jgi:hypothetical protein
MFDVMLTDGGRCSKLIDVEDLIDDDSRYEYVMFLDDDRVLVRIGGRCYVLMDLDLRKIEVVVAKE